MPQRHNFIDFGAILLLASVLTSIWLRSGVLIAGGESEFLELFYSPQNQVDLDKYIWQEVGTGVSSLVSEQTVFGLPIYFATAFLRSVGLSALSTQWLVIFVLLSCQGVIAYYLTSTVLGEKSTPFACISASLFYILNPYSMVQIWGRFLSAHMLMYVMLPLTLLLYVKGLKERDFRYAIYNSILSVPLSYSLRTRAFLILLWIPLLVYFVFCCVEVLRTRSRNDATYLVEFSAIFVCMWFLLNCWWVLPFVWVFLGGVVIPGPEESGSLGIMLYISQFSNPFYIIRLIRSDYGWSIFSEAASFIIPALILYSIVVGRRVRGLWFMFLLSLLGLFLAKGAAPPFGEVFTWLFMEVPVLVAFRNTFEKFGLILPLAYAPLIGFASNSLYVSIKGRLSGYSIVEHGSWKINLKRVIPRTTVGLMLFLILVPLVWPMWSGTVFDNNYVEVPSYYVEAETWLRQQPDEFRIISMPLTSLGIDYNWSHAYRGIEPSRALFSKPFISRVVGDPTADQMLSAIGDLYYRSPRFWKLMAVLNAKYVVVHRDMDYRARGMDSPESVVEALTYPKPPGNVSSRQLSDCESLTDWEAKNGSTVDLNLDSREFTEGSSSIRARITPTPSSLGWAFLTYSFKEMDLSGSDTLSFWFRANSSLNSFAVTVSDKNGRLGLWNVGYTSDNSWERYELDIKHPSNGSAAQLDYTSVTEVGFGVRQEHPATLWVDDVQAETGVLTHCENSMEWPVIDQTIFIEGRASARFAFNFSQPYAEWVDYKASVSDWTSKKYLTFWMRRDDASGLLGFRLTLYSDGGQWDYYVQPDSLPQPSVWSKFEIRLDRFAPTGSPDWHNVTTIRFQPTVGWSRYQGKVWIDGIAIDAGVKRAQEHISYDGSFGELDFYKIDNGFFLERMYAANSFLRGDLTDVLSQSFTPGRMILIQEDQVGLDITKLAIDSNKSLPHIAFTRVDPTAYSVRVTGAESPFFLVLSETYDQRWKAHYEDSREVPEQFHFISNGYANTWYVNCTGSYEMKLEFTGQDLLYIGSNISIVSFVVSVICMIVVNLMPSKSRFKIQRVRSSS